MQSTLEHPAVTLDRFGCPRRTLRGDRNQCPACREFFNSSGAFGRHRVTLADSGRACLDLDQMRGKGYAINGAGYWVRMVREGVTVGAGEA